MGKIEELKELFISKKGVLTTKEISSIGLSSRQISKLIEDGTITKIKKGFYESEFYPAVDETIISKIFPDGVLCLESALFLHGYSDRVPFEFKLAVVKNSYSGKFNIDYPKIMPVYVIKDYFNIGIEKYNYGDGLINVYNKERTICDTIRYESKLDREIFANAIKRYVADKEHNISRLGEYGKIFKIEEKIKNYVGVWL